MKTRVRRYQIQAVLGEYIDYSGRFINRLFSPAYMEQIKFSLDSYRQMRMQAETNPAFELPILYHFDVASNSLFLDVDLSNALVLDDIP